jgi:hypothetical protein
MPCGPLSSALKLTEEVSNIYCNYGGTIVSTLTACTSGKCLENSTSQGTRHKTLSFFCTSNRTMEGFVREFIFTLHGCVDCQQSWSVFLYFHSSYDLSVPQSDLRGLLVRTEWGDARKKILAFVNLCRGVSVLWYEPLCQKRYWRHSHAVPDLSLYLYEFHLVAYHWEYCSWILTHLFFR